MEKLKKEEKREIFDFVFSALHRTTKKLGVEAYIVGGAPRDIICGLEPKDIDVIVFGQDYSTFAKIFISEIGEKANFFKAKKYEMIRIILSDNLTVDISPPKSKNLIGDLKRRDFTINTLVIPLKDPKPNILDPLGVATDDITRKFLRTPSDPEKTFSADPCRIIRAGRFVSDGFFADEKLISAMKKKIPSINSVPKERQGEELRKLFLSKKPSLGLFLLRDIKFFNYAYPKIVPALYKDQKSPYHFEGVFEHCARVVDLTPPDIVLRLSAFFHDIGKAFTEKILPDGRVVYWGHEVVSAEIAEDFLSTFKFPYDERKKIVFVVKNHMIYYTSQWSDSAIRRLLRRIGDDPELVLKFVEYDIKALKDPSEKLKNIQELRNRIYSEILKLGRTKIESPIDGYEIQKIFNLKPGPLIGQIKQEVINAIVEGKIEPNKESAISFIREYLKQIGQDSEK